MATALHVSRPDGIRPPGDKSITHRALMLASLVEGRSRITGALSAQDTRSVAAALRTLGCRVSALRREADVVVTGTRWRAPEKTLHCGNSGTAARLLCGLLAARPFPARLTGDRSLRRRPMGRVIEPLRQMHARFETSVGDRLPLTIHGGPLVGIRYQSPVASAQVKTAILFAALVAGVDAVVEEPWRSRDHTERLLAHLGVHVLQDGTTVSLPAGDAGRRLPPFELDVPGDPSSAAFLVAASLLGTGGDVRIRHVGVNPTRTGFLRVLERMGARVEIVSPRMVGNEPVADLVVHPVGLRGTHVSASEVPTLVDEVPVLAVLASLATGETVFREVGELRVKESNRLELLAANLRAVGAKAAVEGDSLAINGSEYRPSGRVDTAGDHRLAMAFAVLNTVPRARITLSERASPGISYPGFFDDLSWVTQRGR